VSASGGEKDPRGPLLADVVGRVVLHPVFFWLVGAFFAGVFCDAMAHGPSRYAGVEVIGAAILSAALFVAAAIRAGPRR
jgi:hypothetical protein